MTGVWRSQVTRLCSQYLQLEPTLDFPSRTYLPLPEVQHEIYNRLFSQDKVGHGHPPPIEYRLRVLKELVHRIEAAIDDWSNFAVSDDLMFAVSALMCTPLSPQVMAAAQEKCNVTYHLSLLDHASHKVGHPNITLRENRGLIAAGGTTGHRTWESGLHLGQFLCVNPRMIAGKNVLELGTGTGYLAVLCSKYLGATHVIASDGSDDVLDNLTGNLYLNMLQDSPTISSMKLVWGRPIAKAEVESGIGQAIDVILGADVTYDRRVIPALVATLHNIIQLYPTVQIYISAVERNAATLQDFFESCKQQELMVRSIQYAKLPYAQQSGPFYSDEAEIRLLQVSAS